MIFEIEHQCDKIPLEALEKKVINVKDKGYWQKKP